MCDLNAKAMLCSKRVFYDSNSLMENSVSSEKFRNEMFSFVA